MATKENPLQVLHILNVSFHSPVQGTNWIGENATKADDDLQHKCQEYTGEEGYYFFEDLGWSKGH
jgi:hypothetical protein